MVLCIYELSLAFVLYLIQAYGHLDHDPSIHRHFERTYDKGIFQMTQRVLSMAKQEQCSSAEAAMRYVCFRFIRECLIKQPCVAQKYFIN